jgi:hypothetical protein
MPLFRRGFIPLVAVEFVLASVSCNLTETYPLGNLSVQVLNQSNAGVQGALLDLYKLEGGASIAWRATATNSDGIGVFGARDGGVIEGDYFIRLILTPAFELAPGESNDRPVTVREGDDITVTFRVMPRSAP